MCAARNGIASSGNSTADEEWRVIKGYEKYQVSNHGRVKSFNKHNHREEKIMSLTNNGYGYLIVCLRDGNCRKNHYVHRLVAEAFLDNPNNLPQVNHKDYNRKNNHVNNLEWITEQGNKEWSKGRGRHPRKSNRSKTGYQYIYKRGDKYRVTIWHKFDRGARTLEEAIKIRDSALKEFNYYYD